MSLVIIIGVLIAAGYLLNTFLFSYWSRKGFKQLDPSFFIGNAGPLLKQKMSFGEFFAGVYNENKDRKIVGIYFFQMPILVVVDTKLLQDIMIKDFTSFHDRPMPVDEVKDPLSAHLFSLRGKQWRDLRVKLTPTFTSGKLKGMFPIIKDAGQVLEDYLVNQVKQGNDVFEFKDLMMRFTLNIIASVAFGIEADCIKDPDNIFHKMGEKILEPNFKNGMRGLFAFLAPQLFHKLNLKFVDSEVEDFIYSIVNQTIALRDGENITRNDFMQLMIQLKNQGYVSVDKDDTNSEDVKLGSKNEVNIKKLTVDEIAAQAFVFYVAGFETSSTTMLFCLFELARNKRVQQKVHDEIDKVYESAGPEGISYESLGDMKYLECCIDETLRKYPIVPLHLRTATREYKIEDSNLVIPKGSTVFIPVLGFHRDPEIYDEPMEFRPERFLTSSNGGGKADGIFYVPFGDGPRNCIGMRMGKFTTKIGLSVVLSKFNIELVDKELAKQELEIHPKVFNLAPLKPFMIKLTPRKN